MMPFSIFRYLLPLLTLGGLIILAQGNPSRPVIDQAGKTVELTANGNVIRLQPWSAGTIRVEAASGASIPEHQSLAVIAKPDASGWTVEEKSDAVVLKGARMSASVDKNTGLVTFLNPDGSTLLKQTAWSFQPAQDAARNGLAFKASFQRSGDEHLYGGGVLGNELTLPSSNIVLANNNTQIRIPVLYSSAGYGFFWDNASRGHLHLEPSSVTWEASAGDGADVYVMAGPGADAAVAEYRNLTGAAPLFPKWAYGFWFSKNRFTNQAEILKAAQDFRTNEFPVDLLVQDYFYWKPDGPGPVWDGWGSHQFVASRYPDPKGMIGQLHDQFHIHFMTVIWPRFDIASAHAQELDAIGALYPLTKSNVWETGTRFYDPFNADARKLYGKQVMDSLLPLGVDAWWMDGAEPEISDKNLFSTFQTGLGPASRVMNAYPMMHTQAVYEAQRTVSDAKRAVLLPRSSWAGMQRYGAANWTGDIRQDWKTLAWQIQGLQNYSISGLPYITTDVGGYSPTPESDRELFVRWFQWGSFCPIFRVHGIGRPFPWDYGTDGLAILKKFDLLHYRLLPYIYSQAATVTLQGGTLQRPLVMDFRDDSKALSTWDEFMFGPSLLVCPVYTSTREPAASVTDFADTQGQSAAVTVTYLKAGNGTPGHKDLKDDGGFEFKQGATGDEKSADSTRIEGVYTPKQSGALALEVCEPHADANPVTVSVEGKTIASQPAGAWQFPLFPFDAQTGVPVHFVIETKMSNPAFRIVRVLPGPLHRDVYLPGTGSWYDFWTGERVEGSKSLQVETPLDMIPLYVRAGAIIPMGPEIQYAAQGADAPIDVRVYRGADGAFNLYDDEGDNYDYEKGAHATIPISWNEASHTLTFGARQGSYPGMAAKRTFQIIWVGPSHGVGEGISGKSDGQVIYEGQSVSVKAP